MEEASDDNESKDDEDNHLELAVDSSIVVSNLQLQALRVNEGLAKLKIHAVAEVLDWVKEKDTQYVACLKAFYKIKSNASNFLQ